MCGQYELKILPHELQEFFDLLRKPEWTPSFNIKPTHKVVVIRQNAEAERIAESMEWGLIPRWAKTHTGALINARSETIATKPSFRESFKSRRCLIPAAGFFEFESTSSRTKQKWHIYRRDHALLPFAGIWDTWLDEDQQAVETCSIVTTQANAFMAQIHDRMPVILAPDVFDRWLDPTLTDATALQPLLVPCPEDWLTRDPVASLHNENSPRCIEPVKIQKGLFD